MGIHLHLPRLASCLFWPIAKSGFMILEQLASGNCQSGFIANYKMGKPTHFC